MLLFLLFLGVVVLCVGVAVVVARVVEGRFPPARNAARRGRGGSQVQGGAQRHRVSDAEGALDLGGTAPQAA